MSPLKVVLISPRNPLNIGAAARAMSNFGFSELRLVNPYDVAFREARSAVKAQAVLEQAREYPTVAEAVADCGLVVGTTSIGHRALEHPLRRLELGGKLDRAKTCYRARRAAVRVRKIRAVERRHEPLPLADAHSHARGARLDEPRAGRGGVSLRDHPQSGRRQSRARSRSAPRQQLTSSASLLLEECWINPATCTRASKDRRA